MKEIENPSIPSHPPLSITDRNAREGISLGKTFPIREHGSRTGRVQGPRANEKIEHSLRGPMLRIFGYRAPSPPIVDLISSRERTRERESPARNFLVSPLYTKIEFEEERIPPPRIHRDLTRCASPDPYLRRGLPRASALDNAFLLRSLHLLLLSSSLWRNGVLQKGGGESVRGCGVACSRSMISVFFLSPRRNESRLECAAFLEERKKYIYIKSKERKRRRGREEERERCRR